MSETEAVPTASPDMPATETSLPSPGGLIRRTRERAGMPLEELAAQMKLSKSTLDALERDDFDQLKEPVYVRGYYRKCAKVLPIPEQDLIAAYEARVRPRAPATPSRIILAGGVSSGARRGPGIGSIVGGVLVLLVLALFAWKAEHRAAPPSTATELTPAEPAAETPAVPASPAAAPAESARPAAAPAAAAPAATTEAAPAKAPVAAAAPASPAAPNQLVVTLTEPSWVRVEDSRNMTLAIGLVRAGERKVLDGEPPYTVFLGNAAQAQLEFGGKSVDVKSHIKENGTARFTVP